MQLLYVLSIILLLATPVVFLIGLIKPQRLSCLFGQHVSRRKIFAICLVAFIGFGILVGATELESAKQARLAAEHQNQQAAQAEELAAEQAKEKREAEQKKAEAAKPVYYTVQSITDGDTIKLTINGKSETIRLIGIDAPESVHPSKPVECFGKEASGHLKNLLATQEVRLEKDSTQSDRDKYQRLLRYVYLEDGNFINQTMLADGYAFEYTYDSNPYKYQTDFKQAQTNADSNDKGLWAPTACNGEHKAAIAPAPPPPPPAPAPIPPPAPPPAPAPTPPPAASNCDPNYSGCVPIASDVDCAGGSGNGPAYVAGPVTVVGSDIYGLDRDGNGVGCE